MLLLYCHYLFLLLCSGFVVAESNASLGIDNLAAQALMGLRDYSKHNGNLSSSTGCTFETAVKRRDWHDLTENERKHYIDAVLCLSKRPAITPTSEWPGVRNRYDDFVATHVHNSMDIHGTSSFLPWHRYFVYTYEKSLRSECNYTGYQPYWNHARYADNPLASPIFDGSEVSFSGTGIDAVTTTNPDNPLVLPYRGGGGCIFTGPFMNWTVNIGPIAKLWLEVPDNSQLDGRAYNPRCIRRDVNAYVSSHSTTDTNITDLITQSTTFSSFQKTLESTGDPLANPGVLGVHAGGHYTHGGDPGGDFFMSPGDPVFWLHHAGIDRYWWMWQNYLAPKKRTMEIGLTMTMFDDPPSRNGTLEDVMDFGVIGGRNVRVGDVMSSLKGEFCYVYV
ncbi:Di-copper centre-containing protein [Tothia fuscella]|uniref:Di-copper centre-containing protein n=1 Tax=Tothia fuscella TaxID=1048955 RepID=A0A9P4NV31_9PEZI|nr:Di-copper centre-containing protein [Tothia fuscella]